MKSMNYPIFGFRFDFHRRKYLYRRSALYHKFECWLLLLCIYNLSLGNNYNFIMSSETSMDEKEKYEKRQAFEHDLINRRLTWLFSSQTLLFTALALVLRKDVVDDSYRIPFFKTISYLGMSTSFFLCVAICMGVLAKYKNYIDEKKSDMQAKWGVRTGITKVALIPDLLMPIGFFTAWVYFRYTFL
jgi:hypothetical protein